MIYRMVEFTREGKGGEGLRQAIYWRIEIRLNTQFRERRWKVVKWEVVLGKREITQRGGKVVYRVFVKMLKMK